MKSFKSFITEVKQPTGGLKKACWSGYTAVGTKEKNGRTVPNCVPEEIDEDGGAGAVGSAGPTAVTGGVAGMGAQGPKSNQSEPGVYNDKRKKKSPILLGMFNRKPPKA
jgi:hypothetical protein